jgi:transposase
MTQQPVEIQVKDIDHLGIVAGMIDQMGWVDVVNEIVGVHSLEQVSTGQVLKAMLLNGLGFVAAPLYLFGQFFEGKATEHLIGEGVKPEHLNDDRLGRALDKIYCVGVTQVFTTLAMKAVEQFGLSMRSIHLDSSSFHVDGEYLSSSNSDSTAASRELEASGDSTSSQERCDEQRWLIVESEQRKQADMQQLHKRIDKEHSSTSVKLRQLSAQVFACEPDVPLGGNQV